jgi:hypothetical protein
VQTTSDRHMTSYCGIDFFGVGGMSSLYMTLGSVRIALPIRHILAHEEFASVVSRRARVRCTDSGIFSPHPCFEVCWCVFLDTHPDTLGLLGSTTSIGLSKASWSGGCVRAEFTKYRTQPNFYDVREDRPRVVTCTCSNFKIYTIDSTRY